jgi:O-antigen/teichoic acid export membrane protein
MDIDRSSVIIYASNIILSLIGFVGTAYFAQTLGGTVLGIFFTFDAVTSVLMTGARLGVDTGIEKRISESATQQRGSYLTAGYLITLVPIAVMSLGLFVFESHLDEYIGVAAVPLLIVFIISSTGRWLTGAAVRGEGRVALSSLIELFGEVIRIVTSIGLIIAGLEIFALLYGVLIGVVVKFVIFYFALSTSLSIPTWETVRDLWGFSKYTSFNSVSSLAYNWADTLVLAYFASKTAVAVYEASWKVSVVAVMASQALSQAVFPSISEWASRDEYGRIETALSEGFTYGLLLVIPAVVGVAILADPFMKLVYDFDTGGLILILLMAEKLLQAPRILIQRTLTGIGHPNLVFRTAALTLVANVGLNLLLVPELGSFGAAAATITTVSIALVIQIVYLRRFITVTANWRALGRQTVTALAMGVVVYVAATILPPSTLLKLGGLVALGVVAYGLGMATDREIRERVLQMV